MEDMAERARRGETRAFYRVPRKGNTATQRRIAEAVDDVEWQRVRHSMKGTSTSTKIDTLEWYYDEYIDKDDDDNVILRIDNYIKALCRGGQLEAGMTIDHFADGCIRNHIQK